MNPQSLRGRMYSSLSQTGTGNTGIVSAQTTGQTKWPAFMKRQENTVYEVWMLRWYRWEYLAGTIFYLSHAWGLTRGSKVIGSGNQILVNAQDMIHEEFIYDTDQFGGYDTPVFDAGNGHNEIVYPADRRPILLEMPWLHTILTVYTDAGSRLWSVQLLVDIFYAPLQVDDNEYNRYSLMYNKR